MCVKVKRYYCSIYIYRYAVNSRIQFPRHFVTIQKKRRYTYIYDTRGRSSIHQSVYSRNQNSIITLGCLLSLIFLRTQQGFFRINFARNIIYCWDRRNVNNYQCTVRYLCVTAVCNYVRTYIIEFSLNALGNNCYTLTVGLYACTNILSDNIIRVKKCIWSTPTVRTFRRDIIIHNNIYYIRIFVLDHDSPTSSYNLVLI